jgi:hypothetical protein
MNTWAEYFMAMGVLLLFYCFFRILLSWGLEPYERPPGFVPTDWNRTADAGKPIDASQFSARITCVRQDYQAELQPKTMFFKRVLRVRDKREEIAQKAFFVKSASTEASEEGQNPSLLQV